jgi:hypothetical protein
VKTTTSDALKIAGIVAAGIAAYMVVVRLKKGGVAGATQSVVTAAAGAAADVAVGAVKGAGSILGIPDTDMEKCRADLAAGNWWDASFSCPLPVYAKAVKEKIIPSTAAPVVGLSTGENQSAAETARLLRNAANTGYTNPLTKPEGTW